MQKMSKTWSKIVSVGTTDGENLPRQNGGPYLATVNESRALKHWDETESFVWSWKGGRWTRDKVEKPFHINLPQQEAE